jgi:hypothetical protein
MQRSEQKGKDKNSGREEQARGDRQRASAQSVEHETAGMPGQYKAKGSE